jgi:hypothetical protein
VLAIIAYVCCKQSSKCRDTDLTAYNLPDQTAESPDMMLPDGAGGFYITASGDFHNCFRNGALYGIAGGELFERSQASLSAS